MVFPGHQDETWTWDGKANAWYYHRFYDFEPDLNTSNEAVQAEIDSIMGFWLALGVAGFRMDAAPFVIELTEPGNPNTPKDFDQLTRYRERLSWRRGDAVVLAEANVENEEVVKYFGDSGGSNNRLPMLFDFVLSVRTLLALARENADPIRQALDDAPLIPSHAQWATFLRNHDEVDLSRLSKDEQAECFAAFGPEPQMQIYGRGIRRRLAPMLGGDQARLRLAYSLQFTLPGTPVLRYGEELGMGDDLSQPERDSIRTPMQWSDSVNGGFSPSLDVVRPVIQDGEYGYPSLNVGHARLDPDSLLNWFERMIRTLRECPEVGVGTCTTITATPASVLVHRMEARQGSVLFLHNLSPRDVRLDLDIQAGEEDAPVEMFSDRRYDHPTRSLAGLALGGYGYRWIRLRRSPWAAD